MRKPCGALLVVLVLVLLASAPACSRPAPTTDDISSEWTLTPAVPTATQPATARLTLLYRATQSPVRGAVLRFEAQMSHPGMVPVIENASEVEPGVYTGTLTLTMGGDWTVLITGTLPDGRSIRRSAADIAARAAH